MDLSDLKSSISSMSDEDLMTLFKDIRANRRMKKKPSTAKVNGNIRVKKEQTIGMEALLKALPQDQLETLIKQMEGMK
ncbi:MAG: hypothetical protein BWY21_00565 [Parcubacteria group bacterium ADurb.Bin216]|nr:MAG: hypothetical protein BWY21_00565 [Parcubacteria group bacterium ADurb.Bin216]